MPLGEIGVLRPVELFGTLLAMNGVHPKVMQELAGHYSSQITMDIYTHVNMDAKRAAVEAVSKVF